MYVPADILAADQSSSPRALDPQEYLATVEEVGEQNGEG